MNGDGRRRTLLAALTAAVLAAALAYGLRHSERGGTEAVPAPGAIRGSLASDEDTREPAAATAVVPELARTEPPARAPSAVADAGTFDEAELMRLLRSARGNDPALASELAREGNRRFPTSPDAPERASILIHALSEQGRTSEARGEAEQMVNRYPESAWVHEIERFTGAHRHRNARVNAQGELEFYDPPPS